MNRNLLAGMVCLGLLIVAGCSKSNDAAQNTNPAAAPTPSAETTGNGATVAPAAPGKPLTIAVIPKGTTHIYWQSVKAGAEQAGKDLGVTIEWKGPLLESDRAGQIQIVQQFIADGVNGIVLAPLDNVALKQPVDEAMEQMIPVDIIDSALEGNVSHDFISFIATDNKAGGMMGGEELCRQINNKGKVILLRYEEGSASTLDREQGFLDAVAKHPDVQVLVSNRYAGATLEGAKTTSLEMIDQIKQADGVFCSNDPTTTGMLLTLRDAGLAGKTKFVGFDANDETLKALKAGEINAIVVQNPVKMGYEGVRVMVNYLRGKPFETHIDSGAKLVTPANIDDPDTKSLLGIK